MLANAPPARLAAARNASFSLAILFVAAIFLPLLGSVLPIDPSPATTEKRRLAQRPNLTLSAKAISEFPESFEAYYRDGFAFRGALIRLHSLLKFHLFGTGSEFVLIGKNGWLYLTDKTGELIGQHRGTEPLSAAHLDRWQSYLDRRRKWFDDRGIVYLMAVPPSKMTIYPEHLPDWVNETAGETPLDQLSKHLHGRAADTFLDLRPRMLAERRTHRVYNKTDTHWNDVGAYAGYREIHRRLTLRLPDLRRLEDSELERGRNPTYSGDLAGGLNLKRALSEPRVTLAPGTAWRAHEVPMDIALSDEIRKQLGSVTLLATGRPGPVAIVFGDSFLGRLIPFLATSFSKTYYVSRRPLVLRLIEIIDPDVVVHEVTERNMRYPTEDAWEHE